MLELFSAWNNNRITTVLQGFSLTGFILSCTVSKQARKRITIRILLVGVKVSSDLCKHVFF